MSSALHVFGSGAAPPPPPGPSVLPDAFAGIVFATDFTTLDDKGNANCYQFCWIVTDILNGYKLIAQFQQNTDGTHQVRTLLSKNGQSILNEVVDVTLDPLGNPSPVKTWGTGDTIQFFLNIDRTLQFFWYRNGPIVFNQNVTDIPTDFTISDEAIVPMPMEGSALVTFTGFKGNAQMGEISGTANHVPTLNASAPATGSNLVYTLTGTSASTDGITFSIASPT